MKYYLTLTLVHIPQLAWTLRPSLIGAGWLYVRLVAFLVAKKVFRSHSGWVFSFVMKNMPVTMRLYEGSPDIAALIEIFVLEEYLWPELDAPQVILDLGAHTGNTALFFHAMYSHATIYAVEASPQNFARLCENVAAFKNIIPVHKAVGASDEDITFYESASSLGSSTSRRHESDRPVVVSCCTLESLYREQNIESVDLIKIDIEGAEEMLFRAQPPEYFATNYMLEVHGDLMQESTDDFMRRFSAFSTVIEVVPDNSDRLLVRAAIV